MVSSDSEEYSEDISDVENISVDAYGTTDIECDPYRFSFVCYLFLYFPVKV